MAHTRKSAHFDTMRFQDFFRAGIGDLSRLVVEAHKDARATTPLPKVPQAAQLSMFLLLVAKGIEPKHDLLFPHADRLTRDLQAVYKQSKSCWEAALQAKNKSARADQLWDAEPIRPFVARLTRYADKYFGLPTTTLWDFGVHDVQLALASLVRKLAAGTESALGLNLHHGTSRPDIKKVVKPKASATPAARTDIPGAILGGLLVAKIGADAGLQGSVTRDHVMATRVGVSMGLMKQHGKDVKPAAAKKLRKTLESFSQHT